MHVAAVHRDPVHRFSKVSVASIDLLEGIGVAGDAHSGVTVQHRSRVARDPSQPNLRQVHLLHSELLEELRTRGHDVTPGLLGENLTTTGVDLLALSAGTLLHLGDDAIVRVTGLRNPCYQIDECRPGVLAEVVGRTHAGEVVRRAGVMAVVERSGRVRAGDAITVTIPEGAHSPLRPV